MGQTDDATRRGILDELARCVDGMDEDGAADAARRALECGIDPYEAITQGCSRGMQIVSRKYDSGEYFVPEILICADAMYAAIDVLRPHLRVEDVAARQPVIIGVIEGDVHDIGKNIVKLMLDAAGFQIHDLGRDVAVDAFVAKARELGRGIIAASTLMTTTRRNMARLCQALRDAGLKDSFRVMIGGGAVSEAFAEEIGADCYGHNAMMAVEIATAWEGAAK